MSINLNEIFHLSDEQIRNSKIELNMKAGAGGEDYLTTWLKLPLEDKQYGVTGFSYWAWYTSKARNFHEGQTVFSFIRMRHGDEWLFVSAAEILHTPRNNWAEVRCLDQYKGLFGRLIIRHRKGQTQGRYTFNLSGRINACEVKEILPYVYDGEEFAGYDNLSIPFALLEKTFQGEIMRTTYEALQKITGVYCLTDRETGKLYIGSATGDGGVSQRWGNYLDSKHGGNKKLRALYDEKQDTYFEKNFVFTLIEYFGLSYDKDMIIQREEYWKRCLDTIRHGYNDVGKSAGEEGQDK